MLDGLLAPGLWSQFESIPARLVPSGRGPGAALLTIEQIAAGARSDVGERQKEDAPAAPRWSAKWDHFGFLWALAECESGD